MIADTHGTRVVLTGVNHRRIAIDLAKVDSIEDMSCNEVHLWIGGEQYRVSGSFDDIVNRWMGDTAVTNLARD